jgi:hypothetical protein
VEFRWPPVFGKFLARLIPEQFFQVVAGGFFTGVFDFLGHPLAAAELEVFAKIADVLFVDEIGAAFPALFGGAGIVALAVEAHAQIDAALHAGFTAAGVAVERPRLATIMAMSSHRDLRFAVSILR